VQGFSGLMSLTGTPETAPTRAGYIACDAMGAMTAAFAIAAALVRKQQSGVGEYIDVALLDATLASMAAWVVSNYLNAGAVPKPMGNENHSAAPSGTYRCKSSQINIVNNEEHQFHSLCDVVGHAEWKSDPRFAERHTRVANREVLRGLLEQALAAKTAAEWEPLFTKAGVPAGPVLNVPDVLAHAQIAHRGLLKTFPDALGDGRHLTVPKTGFRLGTEQPDANEPPPTLGQHTEQILRQAGYDAAALAHFKQAGVI
jgi:formyl-CoA transferase